MADKQEALASRETNRECEGVGCECDEIPFMARQYLGRTGSKLNGMERRASRYVSDETPGRLVMSRVPRCGRGSDGVVLQIAIFTGRNLSQSWRRSGWRVETGLQGISHIGLCTLQPLIHLLGGGLASLHLPFPHSLSRRASSQ